MSIYDDINYGIDIYKVDDARKDLRRVKEYFQSQPYHDRAMEAFLLEHRQLPESCIKDLDAFFILEDQDIDELPEWLIAEPMGMLKKGHLTYAGRVVFPVKSPKGEVMGFIGWEPFDKPKYLDSDNYGYKAKVSTFFGMENLPKYYTDDKPIFITEGLMCTAWLRANGFHAMASLGSVLSKYCINILKRFGNRCYIVPDNDEAGLNFLNQVRYTLPQARKIMVRNFTVTAKKAMGDGTIEEREEITKDIEQLRLYYEEELLEDLRNLDNPSYRLKVLIRV